MSTCKVGYLVGIGRQPLHVLHQPPAGEGPVRLAPPELALTEIPLNDRALPMFHAARDVRAFDALTPQR